jgi:CubicO group peptidase (beta-lactamase class C family)
LTLDLTKLAIERHMAHWGVPGLALTVVQHDEVLISQGFGVRELGQPEPFDADTISNIGSTSKAFCAATVAILVDQGLLGWDDRVVDHLPWLQLADPWVTRELRVLDLLCHRTGYGDMELLKMVSQNLDDCLRRLRWVEPEVPFRSRFVYNNQMFGLAGRLVEELSGMRWQAFVEQELFAPLGMTRSRGDIGLYLEDGNRAMPHEPLEPGGEPVRIGWDFWVRYRGIMEPAGGVFSTALDLAAWLRLHLNGGRARRDGARLLSAEAVRQMHTPHLPLDSVTTASWFAPGSAVRLASYGLGWSIAGWHGRTLIKHLGGNPGFRALVALLPEEELGLAIVDTGAGARWFRQGLMYAVFAELLGLPETNALDRSHQQWQAQLQLERQALVRARATRVAAPPRLPLAAYAGVYRDAGAYGEAIVTEEGDGLWLQLGILHYRLEPWQFETFRLKFAGGDWLGPADDDEFVTFTLDATGCPATLRLVDVGVVVFNRLPDK